MTRLILDLRNAKVMRIRWFVKLNTETAWNRKEFQSPADSLSGEITGYQANASLIWLKGLLCRKLRMLSASRLSMRCRDSTLAQAEWGVMMRFG